MKNFAQIRSLAQTLEGLLEGVRYVTAEELAERLRESKADITRAFALLGRQGWSFRPSNHVAYERLNHHATRVRNNPIHNRGRKKGDTYDHDPHEPYWTRTNYRVTPPKNSSYP